MTLNKLLRVLAYIGRKDITRRPPAGYIGTNAGGEVTIYFNGELEEWQHGYMRRVGFVNGTLAGFDAYVYRPRIRVKKAPVTLEYIE